MRENSATHQPRPTLTIPDNAEADVPLPPGARILEDSIEESWRVWEGDYRFVWTEDHTISDGCGHEVTVYGSALQYPDGTLDGGGRDEPPCVRVVSSCGPITVGQARELAALILQVADEIDGWVQR